VSRRTVGIDIGGTKVSVAAVREDGAIASETSIPTESRRGFDSGVARITAAIAGVLGRCGWGARDLHGIGVGCAGPVDRERGTIENPHTLPGWSGGGIVEALRAAFGCPVLLENDADMALLGEFHAGAGRGFDPVVMLTFGTGVGGAALAGGKLLRGAGGEHPELGHVLVDPAGPPCYCGSRGCLEVLASGPAVAAAAPGLGDARRVLALAAAGDPAAVRGREQALRATASAAFSILHSLLPERLVLGGGMMDEHYEAFAAAVADSIGRAALIPRGRVSVARAQLGNRAGLVGAARATWEEAP